MTPNIPRLETLADFLWDLEPKGFNIIGWGSVEDCGTVACAGGHATTIPTLREAGLSSIKDKCDTNLLMPVYEDSGFKWTGLGALCHFFGLTADQAMRIFYSYSYPLMSETTPRNVATRIREIIAEIEAWFPASA